MEARMCCCGENKTMTTIDVKDPVCGMTVDPIKAAGRSDFDGTTHYFCSKSCKDRFDADPKSYINAAGPASKGSEVDAVCGMKVQPAEAAARIEKGGRTYYFCSQNCATRFEEDPGRYLQGRRTKPAHEREPEGDEYTCPMHPEVKQRGPGSCPKCGMALEPAT